MEIIIRSRENGWETQRRLELPEDEGLVKSILRSVKKRTSPPAQAGGTDKGQPQAEEAQLPADAHEGQPDPVVFEAGYKGFLILSCAGCGKTYTVNAREPVHETVCNACGHVTELEEMAAVEMRCPECGRLWRYRTNSEEPEVTARCIKCGREMTSCWDKKLRRYLPQER